MKAAKTLVAGIALASVFAMAGCASGLFYPVKSAENAADKVIDDIWPDIGKPAATNAEARK